MRWTWWVVLLLIFTQCISRQSQKMYEKAKAEIPLDVVIVPGCPYEGDSIGWSPLMKIRVYWAHHLYKKGFTQNIIFSGGAVYTPYVESKIMALYAEQLGIPKENIYAETNAEHSTENLYYSYYMAKRLGFKKIGLASDPFQVKMLQGFGRKMKISAVPLPMIFDTLSTFNMVDMKIDGRLARKDSSFVPLPQREGFWKRLRGTLGRNLKQDPDDIRFQK